MSLSSEKRSSTIEYFFNKKKKIATSDPVRTTTFDNTHTPHQEIHDSINSATSLTNSQIVITSQSDVSIDPSDILNCLQWNCLYCQASWTMECSTNDHIH